METDAADGNPLTTRIPTAAWKAQNAFHSSHKARRRFHHRIHFFERQRSTLNTLSFGPKDGEHLNAHRERLRGAADTVHVEQGCDVHLCLNQGFTL